MRRALAALPVTARMALADGRDVPPGLPCDCKALIKGDQRSQSIAAASIVAKVMRDRMMQGCGRADQRYGLEIHMGYATERHRAAIEIHGPATRLHRMSFSPFRLASPDEQEEIEMELFLDADPSESGRLESGNCNRATKKPPDVRRPNCWLSAQPHNFRHARACPEHLRTSTGMEIANRLNPLIHVGRSSGQARG